MAEESFSRKKNPNIFRLTNSGAARTTHTRTNLRFHFNFIRSLFAKSRNSMNAAILFWITISEYDIFCSFRFAEEIEFLGALCALPLPTTLFIDIFAARNCIFISHILCRCCRVLCTPFVISKWNFLRLNTTPSKRDENWCRAMRMANGWLALFATHSSGCCAIVNIINITSALSGRHSLSVYIPKLANDAIKYGMRKKKFSPIDQW